MWFVGTAISLAQMAAAWIAAVRLRRKARLFPGVSTEGVPVLENVAATLRPINPDFPSPVTSTRPAHW